MIAPINTAALSAFTGTANAAFAAAGLTIRHEDGARRYVVLRDDVPAVVIFRPVPGLDSHYRVLHVADGLRPVHGLGAPVADIIDAAPIAGRLIAEHDAAVAAEAEYLANRRVPAPGENLLAFLLSHVPAA